MLDKGCSAEDTTMENNPESLSFLQKCFPAVDISDLEEVLSRCNGDLQWATNILLDTSMEYNEPTPAASPRKAATPTEEHGASADALSTNSSDPSSPPTLAMLCHSAVSTNDLSSMTVQQTFVRDSVRRLKSIEEFKRQHSTQSDGGVLELTTEHAQSDPFSPGGTLQEEVFQTLFRQKSTTRTSSSDMPMTLNVNVNNLVDGDVGSSVDPGTSDSHPAGQDETAATAALPAESAVTSTAGAMSTDVMSVTTPIEEVIEEELKEMTPEVDLPLELPQPLAKQLIHMFGPVAFHISPESLSQEDLTVHLNRGMARRLHHCWALTLQEKFAQEELSIQSMMKQDEELARRLQEEENEKHLREVTPSRKVVAAGGRASASPSRERTPHTPPRTSALIGSNGTSSPRTESFRYIMDEETALQASRQAYLQEYASRPDTEMAIATRLKRQKLQEIFPGIDTATLEEIFQANGYELGATVSAINASLGRTEPVKDVMTNEAIAAYENKLIQQAQEESLRLHERQMAAVVAQAQVNNEAEFQTMEDPGYQDFRAETSIHYQLRAENFQKAQEAYRRGLKEVASFYSRQGHLHSLKLKEANRRAAAKIIELRNEEILATNKVDLHMLHVDEALEVLAELLNQRQQELKLRKDKRKHWLEVVTGRGIHSQGGVARIKRAVTDYLKKNKYIFFEIHAGSLRVQLKN